MYTDKQIIEALKASGGNQAAAARALDCSRNTIRKRINDSPDVEDAYNSVNEANLDKAENKLIDLVKDEDHRDHFKALRFYLRTKGRARGYGDSLDVTTKGDKLEGANIVINSQGNEPEIE